MSFDHRGEGCSKTLRSNLDPDAYQPYRVREIVNDMEFLRERVFKYSKWRIFGHSRGSALVHYYLEMAPNSLESAFTSGFSIMPAQQQKNYAFVRARGYQEVGAAYLRLYPGDLSLVQEARRRIEEEKLCWQTVDNYKICGPAALDVLALNFLAYRSAWSKLHDQISQLQSKDGLKNVIQAQVFATNYGEFNYIMGTNAREFGSPSSGATAIMKADHSSPFYNPFLAELRFASEAMAPIAKVDWHSEVDALDYGKILEFLKLHPSFKYTLFSAELDPIAPPEMFKDELQILGKYVRLIPLPNMGHDSSSSLEVMNKVMELQ